MMRVRVELEQEAVAARFEVPVASESRWFGVALAAADEVRVVDSAAWRAARVASIGLLAVEGAVEEDF